MDDLQSQKDENTTQPTQDTGTPIAVNFGSPATTTETKEQPSEASPSVGNDFTTPSASAVTEVLPGQTVESPATPETPATEPSPEVSVSNPVAEPPKDDIMPGLENESDTPPNNAAPANVAPMAGMSAIPSAANAIKKKNSMGLVIAIVAVVVIALAAIGYFALSKKDETPASKAATKDTTAQQTAEPEDTPDTSSAAIDDSLKSIDDSTDFSSSSIDDTTLGL